LSDISALGYNYKYEYKKIRKQQPATFSDDVDLKVLLRHEPNDADLMRGYFHSIDESYLNCELGYLTGKIALKNLRKIQEDVTSRKSFVLLDVES